MIIYRGERVAAGNRSRLDTIAIAITLSVKHQLRQFPDVGLDGLRDVLKQVGRRLF
jgi:hypothetical protein